MSTALAKSYSEVQNGFAKTSDDPQKVNVDVLSPERASLLFKSFVDSKDLNFKFIQDGCHARATEMARIAEKSSISVGKIYAEGTLQVQRLTRDEPLRFKMHVAPVVFIDRGFGKPEPYVLDPSLFNEPVPLEKWKARLLFFTTDYSPTAEFYYGSRYQFNARSLEGTKDSWQEADLASTKTILSVDKNLTDDPIPEHMKYMFLDRPTLPMNKNTNSGKAKK